MVVWGVLRPTQCLEVTVCRDEIQAGGACNSCSDISDQVIQKSMAKEPSFGEQYW